MMLSRKWVGVKSRIPRSVSGVVCYNTGGIAVKRALSLSYLKQRDWSSGACHCTSRRTIYSRYAYCSGYLLLLSLSAYIVAG